MADIERIKGSNGSGEAVRAIVGANRSVGAATLTVDSVSNYPSKFIATSGTLNTETKLLDPATITVFYGEVDGSNILITGYAPGYEDKGHTVGQIVVIKPTTAWADEIAALFAASHDSDGRISSLAQPDESQPKVTFVVSSSQPAPIPDKVVVWFEPLT